jgi:arylsulfate sulfotransferase
MLNRVRSCVGASLIILCLVAVVGCGSGSHSTTTTTPPPPAVTINPAAVTLGPGQSFQFNVVGSGTGTAPVFQVNGATGGSSSTGTITSGGLYTAPATISAQSVTIGVQGATGSATVTLFNPSSFTAGSVATTNNPLVAAYSITAPAGTPVRVQFGPDTNYGFATSTVTAPPLGGSVTVLVAGMRASSTYHMQAIVELNNGSQVVDTDQSFTTGSIPADRLPDLTTQFGTGTPNPGVELFSLLPFAPQGDVLNALATDLEGNVIWYYDVGLNVWPFPIKPLPNGHMLLIVTPDGAVEGNEIREIDLAGNTITSVTLAAVNQSLQAFGASYQLIGFHHDIAVLPNGHWIILGNSQVSNLPGTPTGTVTTGDDLIDWDVVHQTAVWSWSTFDHFDISHAPYGVTDWTHSNAIFYSPDDGQLVMSMRNQNWIIKINYADGAGDGTVLWRFGFQGDFTLPGNQAPIDWNYGQHYPTIVSSNTSGVFSLMFFDNGNNRLVDSSNDVCGTAGHTACYSSVPIFQVDEITKTATELWEDNLFPYYSLCCGDAILLGNGDIEMDIADDQNPPDVSHIQEVTQTQPAQLVWKMDENGQLAYRGYRIPSLYPGEVWPAATPAIATRNRPHHTGSTAKPPSAAKPIIKLP